PAGEAWARTARRGSGRAAPRQPCKRRRSYVQPLPLLVLHLALFLLREPLAYTDQVEGGVLEAIESEQVVDLAVEIAPDVDAAQAETGGHEVDVLRDVTGFQQRKAVAPVSVLVDRALDQRRQEEDRGGIEAQAHPDPAR